DGNAGPSSGDLALALAAGDPEGVAANLSNDLEVAAFDLMPGLAELKAGMTRCGALGALLTGSGSAIIGLCRDEPHARRVAEEASALFPRVEVAHSTASGAEVLGA
ncbi:MAG TPA: 4-(cytidine 5'-diphospho)-2-C-methyl-D-erythritol kinase, partial [Actinomycetota bacterium]|nr:4-(cytidine 5'-diphospho)-2-C-methyl-D-erythritol kinase [Actinomycetota bacterium]